MWGTTRVNFRFILFAKVLNQRCSLMTLTSSQVVLKPLISRMKLDMTLLSLLDGSVTKLSLKKKKPYFMYFSEMAVRTIIGLYPRFSSEPLSIH